MKKLIVMLDVDGVLADFTLAFTMLANRLFGTAIVPTLEQPTWNFHASGQMTKEQEGETWRKLRSEPCWWETLKPLVSPATFGRLDDLAEVYETVYVTSRVSDNCPVGLQTSRWLIDQGVIYPNVIVSPKKGEIARAIGATHALDDKADNSWVIHWVSDLPQTRSLLLDRPYNQVQQTPEVGARNIQRVKTVDEFLDIVEKDAHE